MARLEALHEVDAILFHGRDATGPPWPEIAGYEILAELDRGGMSVVYRDRQLALERNVAIKVLLAGQFASNRLRDRFRREASTVARLRHPNIVQIYDSGESHGVLYLSLDMVVGGNLKTKIAGRPMPPPEAARLVETLARAVDDAHRQGVVHRDLKPSNVLLTGEGIAKIWDLRSFGELATLDGFDEPVDWLAVSPDGHTLVTPSRNSGLAKGQVTLEFWDVDSRKKKLDGAAPGTETLSGACYPSTRKHTGRRFRWPTSTLLADIRQTVGHD